MRLSSFGEASRRAGYATALAAVGGALALRLALAPVLGDETPFILFFGAVLITAAVGGMRPALGATALAAVTARFFFFEPHYSLAIENARQFVQLLLFVLEGGSISYLAGALCTANNASRQSAERLRITLHGIGDGVIVTDVDGAVTVMNPVAEQLTGWGEADARGRALEDVFRIVNERSRQAVENPVRRVLHEGRVQGLANHTLLIARDQVERPIDDSAAPILDVRGRLQGVVLVFRDVSARRRADAQREELLQVAERARREAEQASRAKDNFLAVLSHELRSPLAAMSGWLQVLRRTNGDAAMVERGLTTLERNVALQSQLIDDLLDVSRIVSGKLHLEWTLVDLAALVKHALDAHEPAMAAKGVMLERFVEDGPLLVRGDGERLQQVVANLLSNATKFTAEKGRIEVRLSRQDGEAELTVSDTGIGIAPEFLPHVFTRFAQEQSASVRRHGGLGIGLSVVHEIVRRHQGSARADSAGAGRGATFAVRLPLVPMPASTADLRGAALPAHTAPAGSAPLHVLLVEDDADTRAALRICLEGNGLRVSEATSLEEALTSYEVNPPDLVVSDIGLPGGDGYALVRAIRDLDERHGRPRVLAIALSGFATGQDHEAALRAGFDEHLSKPINVVILLEHIAVLTAPRRVDATGR